MNFIVKIGETFGMNQRDRLLDAIIGCSLCKQLARNNYSIVFVVRLFSECLLRYNLRSNCAAQRVINWKICWHKSDVTLPRQTNCSWNESCEWWHRNWTTSQDVLLIANCVERFARVSERWSHSQLVLFISSSLQDQKRSVSVVESLELDVRNYLQSSQWRRLKHVSCHNKRSALTEVAALKRDLTSRRPWTCHE